MLFCSIYYVICKIIVIFAVMLARLITFCILFGSLPSLAQDYFNTVGMNHRHTETSSVPEKQEDIIGQDVNPFLSLPIEELQEMAQRYVELRDSIRLAHRPKKTKEKMRKLYRGKNLPLSYSNLISVMEDCGIRQPLYVIAQACLETGWFTSKVFNEYNNLFGLYDSKAKDYYRFQSWEDSVAGYAKYIQYRYKGGDYLRFLRRIRYAEDPYYTAKITKIVNILKNK